MSEIIYYVPRYFFGYLDSSPQTFFGSRGVRGQENLFREMKKDGIRYIGDLIQLSEEEVLNRLGGNRRFFDLLETKLAQLNNAIHPEGYKFGLRFGMKVVGWKPNDPKRRFA